MLQERLEFTAEELISNIIADENPAKDYIFIANVLEQNRKCSNVCWNTFLAYVNT